MHLLIKYASRSRPEKFFEGLHNIIDMAADKEKLSVWCSLDRDDRTMFRDNFPSQLVQHFLDENMAKFPGVTFDYGRSSSKINAINRKVPDTIPWDILVNFSDDMRFTVFGYDELIREGFRTHGLDRFLHYPDSTAKMALPTMSIMDRTYFNRDGYIYHHSYKSLFCDNEAMAVAQARGCYVFIPTQIFDHYHPAYGMSQWDEQYHRQQAMWGEDERNFNYRKAKNFDLV